MSHIGSCFLQGNPLDDVLIQGSSLNLKNTILYYWRSFRQEREKNAIHENKNSVFQKQINHVLLGSAIDVQIFERYCW